MSYTHLTEDERYHIDELLRGGNSQSAIARKLGRSTATLSRELRRNQGKRGWRARQAGLKAAERLSARGKANVNRMSELAWRYAQKQLTQEQWSPEQIAGRLKTEGLTAISHETIYQRVLEDKQAGGELHTHLRCKKKRRKRYGSSTPAGAGRGCIPNRVDIEHRPAIVDSRQRVGDWEGDTIIGSYDGGAVIASMVERRSRFTVLAKSKDKTTKAVISEIHGKMKAISAIVETVTFDNGKEFSAHEQLSEELGASVFFAKPYHSWERGLNENTNGLVRQYFPKRTSFDNLSDNELQVVTQKLNNRPRKCLDYKTPFEVLRKLTEKQGVALRI